MSKLTKQGVRDLNSIPSKPAGKKYEPPPVPVNCKHPRKREDMLNGMLYCQDCDWSADLWAR